MLPIPFYRNPDTDLLWFPLYAGHCCTDGLSHYSLSQGILGASLLGFVVHSAVPAGDLVMLLSERVRESW